MVYNQVQRCESGRGELTHLAVDSALLQQVKQLVVNQGLEVQETLGDAVVEVRVDPAARALRHAVAFVRDRAMACTPDSGSTVSGRRAPPSSSGLAGFRSGTEDARIDRRRFGTRVFVGGVGQLLKVPPGFVRPIEGFFAAATLDHVLDG